MDRHDVSDLLRRSAVESALIDRRTPISLVTSDGVDLAGLRWRSATEPPRAIVVLVHGLAAKKDHPHVEELAERLQDTNREVVSYDARGHGESGGTCTLGNLEHLDVAAAAEWAKKRGVPTVLVGASLGGIAVLGYASTHAELDGVVVVSSPAEWRIPTQTAGCADSRSRSNETRPVGRGPAHGRPDQPEVADDGAPRVLADRVACPLAVVHGRRDALIPARWGLEFHPPRGRTAMSWLMTRGTRSTRRAMMRSVLRWTGPSDRAS